MTLRVLMAALTLSVATTDAGRAVAWGDEGHEIVGTIAYARLTPAAKAQVDAMLAADTDTLTAPDFASRATWADKFRDAGGRRLHYLQTRNWHFVDTEISAPDLTSACFGVPPLASGQVASQGPAQDCAAHKIIEFQAELADSSTPAAERLLALKFLMHFVGDIHQPLHASDDHDFGGNCEQVRLQAGGRTLALHHYWDTEAVEAIMAADQIENPADDSLAKLATRLGSDIAPTDASAWQAGDAKAWAMESLGLAQTDSYNLPAHAACEPGESPSQYPAFVLLSGYQTQAVNAAQTQLQKAGVRLAAVLNAALN